MRLAEQVKIILGFQAGEILGLCTVAKVNRGFDLPSISLVVIGFGTASRSKFEQMCGRAQRVFAGKAAAWLLDYGRHGERFGSANWDYPEAIEFDRREKLRAPTVDMAASIRAGKRDPKCECRPDNYQDLTEDLVDLFDVIAKPARSGAGVNLYYAHSLGFTHQYLHASTSWTRRFLLFYDGPENNVGADASIDGLIRHFETHQLPRGLMLRRVFDSHRDEIVIAPVGFYHGGDIVYQFDDKPVVSQEWLRQRARDRMAYAREDEDA